MATLVLNAPAWRENEADAKSFDQMLRDQKGDGYAIWRKFSDRLQPGCRVVLLCKDRARRAEGVLVRLVPTEKTGSGIQRYDVHLRDLREVTFRLEALNRFGVNVL